MFIARPPRDVVVASGPDALSYLQGLVSADLEGLADGDSVHSLLLTPQGKLDGEFYLVRRGDEAWLTCEGGFGERLVESLSRFKIRVKVELAVDASLAVVALRGPGAAEAARSIEGVAVIPVAWGGEEAVDVVGDPQVLPATSMSEDEYEAARISAGVPRMGADLDEKTIPQEAMLDVDAVSFTKGCFLGQELVCRIDTRGHVNKYLRRLQATEAVPAPGAEIVAGDKAVGTITSTAGELALGYVRREVEPPAEVTLRGEGGDVTATVEAISR